jgi:peroxiredoxin/uncharacterized membrane protein YphA (DoxX/SURF4 family)
MSVILFMIELYFSVTLCVAGLSKVSDSEHFRATLYRQHLLPERAISFFSIIFPYIEIALALFLMTGFLPFISSITLVLLFVGFLLVKATLFHAHQDADCGCYGSTRLEAKAEISLAVSVCQLLLSLILLWLVVVAPPFPLWLRMGLFLLFAGAMLYLAIGVWLKRSKRSANVSMQMISGVAPGAAAPLFQAIDQHNTMVALENFRGQPLILVFVLRNCPACHALLADLSRFRKTYPHIAVLLISDANLAENMVYAAKRKIQVPFLTPLNNLARDVYQISTFPTIFFVDEQGIITKKGYAFRHLVNQLSDLSCQGCNL